MGRCSSDEMCSPNMFFWASSSPFDPAAVRQVLRTVADTNEARTVFRGDLLHFIPSRTIDLDSHQLGPECVPPKICTEILIPVSWYLEVGLFQGHWVMRVESALMSGTSALRGRGQRAS